MRPRHPLLFALLLAVLAGAAFAGWALLLRPIDVQVVRLQSDVKVQVFGLGTVEARVTSKVGFKVAGVLVDLQADVRDRVPKGAVLARLDDREQSARSARARAALEQAEANHLRSIANLEKAQANYTNARSISERRQTLLLSNNTSVETAQTAKAAHDAAVADVSLAASDVQLARAAINDAAAQRQLETVTLDFHTLLSPYDAMVIARQRELGSALAAGESVYTVIDPQTIWVLGYIDESKAGEIREGQTAEIVLRSLPGRRFAGRVARIEPESDRVNEERRVQVAFDRLPEDVHLGEQAEVYITTVRLTEALLMPEAAALRRSQGRVTAWLVNKGRIEQQDLTIGHRTLDGRLEVVGGVPDDAFIIEKPTNDLRVGRSATIAAGPAQ